MNLSYLKMCRAKIETEKAKQKKAVIRDSKMRLKFIRAKMAGGLFDIHSMSYTFTTCPGRVYLANKFYKN